MLKGIKKTWLHHVNPSIKLLTLFLLFLLFLFVDDWYQMLVIFLLAFLVLIGGSGFAVKHYGFLLPILCFLFISTSVPMILYGKGEQVIWQWAWIKVSEESVRQGLLIATRTCSLLMISLLFTVTTKPIHLFYSLMQQCYLPPKYAYAFLAVFNLLPQLKAELAQRRLVDKMMKRKRNLRQRFAFYSLPLLSQAIRRAFMVAIAMEVKGFSGETKRTYYYQFTYTRYDSIFLLILLFLILGYVGVTHSLF